MSFYLNRDESLPDGIRRIVCEQIDRMVASLTPPIESREQAIHDARRSFKKIRAILRLMRDELGEDVYKDENRFFRNLGRQLSVERDLASMAEAAVLLSEQLTDKHLKVAVDRIIASLHDEQHERESEDFDAIVNNVREQLLDARTRAEEWPIERDRFAAIDRGLQRIYQDARAAYGVVTGEPTDENLHEWRKHAKHLWYSLRILHSLWPEMLDAIVHELHALSNALGDDHDLALLRSRLRNVSDSEDNDSNTAPLLAAIDNRRAALQETAKSLGARIFSEKPKVFMRRIHTYWRAWRGEERSAMTTSRG